MFLTCISNAYVRILVKTLPSLIQLIESTHKLINLQKFSFKDLTYATLRNIEQIIYILCVKYYSHISNMTGQELRTNLQFPFTKRRLIADRTDSTNRMDTRRAPDYFGNLISHWLCLSFISLLRSLCLLQSCAAKRCVNTNRSATIKLLYGHNTKYLCSNR